MILEWIESSKLVPKQHDSNVLAIFPINIRRTIIAEVTNFLFQSNSNDSSVNNNKSKSASSIGVTGLESLTSMFHVQWVMEVLGQAFSLPLEDINIVSNAVSIYLQWLLEPKRRPPVIREASDQVRQEFIQTIFCHLSLLFDPKSMDGVGAAKALIATLATNHTDLCRLTLRSILQLCTTSDSDQSEQESFSPDTWKMLLRVLLGIADYLLSKPLQPYSYLSEDLGETILSMLIEVWLRSQVQSASLWKSLCQRYPNWTHRTYAITHWSTTSLALTSRIARILYGSAAGSTRVEFSTTNNGSIALDLKDQFVVFAWHQMIHLIGPAERIPSVNFFKAVVGMEKMVQVFLLRTGIDSGAIDSAVVPETNTIMHIFGQWLFNATNRKSTDCADGRAQAYGVLCRIMVRPQLRTPILATYIHQFYAAIIQGLSSDLQSLVFIVFNCEDIFMLDLPNVRILLPAFVDALRRITPNMERAIRININLEELRRACYRLMSTMFSLCDHFGQTCIQQAMRDNINLSSIRPASDDSATGKPTSEYSATLQRLYQVTSKEGCMASAENYGRVRYWIMDTLVASFLAEKDSTNLRYLLNQMTAFAIEDQVKIPELVNLVVLIICKQISTSNWSVDVSMVAAECMRQLAIHVSSESSFVETLTSTVGQVVPTLCSLVQQLLSRNNLPMFFKLISALFDTISAWTFVKGGHPFAKDSNSQQALMQMVSRVMVLGGECALQSSVTSSPPSGRASPGYSTTSLAASGASSRFRKSQIGSNTNLAVTSKPLEMQLGAAAEIMFARICAHLGHPSMNPFAPIQKSTMVNELSILNAPNCMSGSIVNCKLSEMPLDLLPHLQYYILNSNTIVAMVERPLVAGLANGHVDGQGSELVFLVRSVTGRSSWESSLLYTEDPERYRKLTKPSSISDDRPAIKAPRSWNMSADCKELQNKLLSKNRQLAKTPINLDDNKYLNGQTFMGRFEMDEKRIMNLDCVESLNLEQQNSIKEHIVRDGLSMISHRARPPKPTAPDQMPLTRLFLAHSGLTSFRSVSSLESTQRLPTCIELLADMEVLDAIPERELITASVLYASAHSESASNGKSYDDFLDFVHSMAWVADLKSHAGFRGGVEESMASSLPYYADNDVELVLHVPQAINLDNGVDKNGVPSDSIFQQVFAKDPVTVLWLEDFDDIAKLPSNLQTRSSVFICVTPATDQESSGLYRIRIITTTVGISTTSTPTNSPTAYQTANGGVSAADQQQQQQQLFMHGPLLENMLVSRESLGRLVRESVISASLFVLYHLQNQPRPMAKRSAFIRYIANKYRQIITPSKYYNDMLFQSPQ